MVPLTLKLKAFGPFLKEQEIDFTKLAQENLFMVSGPTGSGKTTIFDAITFALYGEPSGETRSSDQFKSDYAEMDDECKITFHFLSGDKEYTVKRKPKQAYINRKGAVSFHQAYAELAFPDGTVTAGVREVDEAVRGILKLTREQFRKIVMLPQGEFRKLLNADSSEKQEIFRKLFSTELYDRFTQMLREQTRVLETKYSESVLLCRSTIKAVMPEEAPPESSVAFEKAATAIGDQLADSKQSYAETEKKYVQTQKAFAEINLELVAERNAKFDRLEAEEKHLNELKKDESATACKRELLTKLRKIETLKALAGRLHDVEESDRTDRQQTETLTKEFETAGVLLKAALEAHVNASNNLAELPNLQARADFFRGQQELFQKKLQTEKQADVTAEKHRRMLREEKELEHWKHCLKCREELFILEAQQNSMENFSKAVLAFFDTEKEYRTAQLAYAEAFQRFLSSQAAYLSGQLKKGVPCPVCGSTEHPHPADASGETVNEQELNALKAEHDALLERFNREYRLLSENFSGCSSLLPFETVEACLNDRKLLWQEAVNEQIRNNIKTAEENYEKHCAEISELSKALPGTLEELEQYVETFGQKKIETEMEAAHIKNELEQLTSQLETELSFEEILKKQTEITKNIDSLRKTAEEVGKHAERAAVREEEAGRRVKDMQQRLTQNAVRLEHLRKEWQSSFDKETNFTEKEFLQLLPSVDNIDELEREVNVHQQNQMKTEQIIETLRQELNGKERIPFEPLQAKKKELFVELETLSDQLRKFYTACETLQNAHSQLKKHLAELETVEADYRNISELYRVSSGNNPQRLALERYVLSAYFDEVITKANLRLERITNSRYTLTRRTEKEKGLRASGLDMDIFDAYTGKSRHVNTLSGGESFQCALCLALGLSDAIAESSGGIRIDTLFIDEGFGSLDAQSLDAAVSCILSLKESGRLVGIISHVEELKEKIPVQLQIIPGTSGSTIQLKLP